MDVNASDHKPVYAVLSLTLPWYQQQQLRRSSMQQLWQAASLVSGSAGGGGSSTVGTAGGCVRLSVEPQLLILEGSYQPMWMVLQNPTWSAGSCRFVIHSCTAGGALPTWLEVTPAAGVLAPGASAAVRVQGTKAHWAASGSRCELWISACLECSRDSREWPAASKEHCVKVAVAL
jgi:hypothetical protein